MMNWERYIAEQKFLASLEVKYGVTGRLHERKWPIEEIAEVVGLPVERTKKLIDEYEKKKKESKEE